MKSKKTRPAKRNNDLDGTHDATRRAGEVNEVTRRRAVKALEIAILRDAGLPLDFDPKDPANRTPQMLAVAEEWADLCGMLGVNPPAPEVAPEPEPEPEPVASDTPDGTPPPALLIPLDDGWRRKAACRDEDGELFFPIGTTGPALLEIEQAKAVCRRCSVSDECLSYAIESNASGIWGGMSEEERRAAKRRGVKHVLPAAA